jgi:hypothetical protein
MKRTLGTLAFVAAIALFAIAVVAYLSAGTACAHDPRFACSPRGTHDPIAVSDPQKSWAFYGHLAPGETDRYTIVVRQPIHVAWSLLVDARDAANPSRPAIRVSDAAGYERAHLDFAHAETFYEPFSRERYTTTPASTLVLPAGTYDAVVRMRGAGTTPQRYTFAVGDAERFSITEIPYVLGAIHRIRALRY